MSLLDTGRETVTVYHAEQFTSSDGNTMYRPSTTDIEIIPNAVVQLASQSGTSARRAEQDDEGYFTEDVYRFRPPRSYTRQIHSQSQAVWRGQRYSFIGNMRLYNGSDNTAHNDYTLRRS